MDRLKTRATLLTLLGALGLVLVGHPATGQNGSLSDEAGRTWIQNPDNPEPVASAAELNQAREQLLELLRFQEEILIYIPERESYETQLSAVREQANNFSDEELNALVQVIRQVPAWTTMIRRIRNTDLPPREGLERSALQSNTTLGECAAPIDPACDDPELEEPFYPFPIPTEVVETAWIVQKVAELAFPIANALCKASPDYPLFINAITCTVTGILDLARWISRHIVADSDRINGNYGATKRSNILIYAESLHDLTIDNSRYTDDVELSVQTDTLIAEINENQALLAAIGEASCEIIRLLNTPPGLRASDLGFCSNHPGWPYDYPNRRDTELEITGAGIPASGVEPRSLFLERELSEGRALPSLYLPASKGGLIEQVRDLVWYTIDAQASLGYASDETNRARNRAMEADQLLERQHYAHAYLAYSAGFRELIPSEADTPMPSQSKTREIGRPEHGSLDPTVESAPVRLVEPLLGSPMPNPATGRISYTINLPTPTAVRVRIYDVSGRLVDELLDRQFDAGRHDLSWQPSQNGLTMPDGIYFLSIEAGDQHESRRFVMVR